MQMQSLESFLSGYLENQRKTTFISFRDKRLNCISQAQLTASLAPPMSAIHRHNLYMAVYWGMVHYAFMQLH
jgi:hypothetical protein